MKNLFILLLMVFFGSCTPLTTGVYFSNSDREASFDKSRVFTFEKFVSPVSGTLKFSDEMSKTVFMFPVMKGTEYDFTLPPSRYIFTFESYTIDAKKISVSDFGNAYFKDWHFKRKKFIKFLLEAESKVLETFKLNTL